MPIIYNWTPPGTAGNAAIYAGQGIANAQQAAIDQANADRWGAAIGVVGSAAANAITNYQNQRFDAAQGEANRQALQNRQDANFAHDFDMADYSAQLREQAAQNTYDRLLGSQNNQADLRARAETTKYNRAQDDRAREQSFWNAALGGAPASKQAVPAWLNYQPPQQYRPPVAAPQTVGPRPQAQVPADDLAPEQWREIAAHIAGSGKAIPAQVWTRAFPPPPTEGDRLRRDDIALRRDVLDFNKSQAQAKANEPKKPTATTQQLAKTRAVTLASDPESIAKVIDDPAQAGKPGQQAMVYTLVEDDQVTFEQRIDLAGKIARVANPTPARRAIVQAMVRKANEQYDANDRANAAKAPSAAAPITEDAALAQARKELPGATDDAILARASEILDGGNP